MGSERVRGGPAPLGAVPSENGDEPLRLGGMALRNGLLIHGPTSWAAAVRAPDDRIHAASGRKPELFPNAAGRIPGLRGPLKLAEAAALLPIVRRRLPAARLPFEDPRVLLAMALTGSVSGFVRRSGPPTPAREAAVALLGLAPAIVALTDGRLAAYHGVEHKAIAAYERGEPDPATVPKEHDRCGSNLVAPLLVLSAAGQITIERLLERPGPIARGVVAVGSVSAAVEMFAWSERNHDHPLARAFHWLGSEIQRVIATREPTAEQLEVGSAALVEVLGAEGVTAGP